MTYNNISWCKVTKSRGILEMDLEKMLVSKLKIDTSFEMVTFIKDDIFKRHIDKELTKEEFIAMFADLTKLKHKINYEKITKSEDIDLCFFYDISLTVINSIWNSLSFQQKVMEL